MMDVSLVVDIPSGSEQVINLLMDTLRGGLFRIFRPVSLAPAPALAAGSGQDLLERAVCLFTGQGTARDDSAAVCLVEVRAKTCCPEAMSLLARFLMCGMHIEKDCIRAGELNDSMRRRESDADG